MDRESLKKSGLLEQYILGLTSRKESLLVERTIEEDPGAREDYDKMRRELDEYAVNNGLATPLAGREVRTSADYEDLDHEMILAMSERNHTLNVWRYALMAACLLLLGLSGYLFRLSETNRTEIVTEKAHHAQDNNAHQQALKEMEGLAPDWSKMRTIKTPLDTGAILLHYLNDQQLILLDLSHAELLTDHEAYFVFFGKDDDGEPVTIVPAAGQFGLHPITMPDGAENLSVFRRKTDTIPGEEELVVAMSLPVSE
ncbi:hypothetical protein FUA23_10725 [Neolewinella aurantiaca]|uniref:Uncharacterized protein n=1 Tax=Neolewinella aurantiaca TaxID=2602767 RepID=A0A5C7FV80_9BACT|nr:hypothetical protein [Neolewinella aurantiaca]TXF89432.1 hypothetical protein FUA23_10725 [Neolewinella aurantiaca]